MCTNKHFKNKSNTPQSSPVSILWQTVCSKGILSYYKSTGLHSNKGSNQMVRSCFNWTQHLSKHLAVSKRYKTSQIPKKISTTRKLQSINERKSPSPITQHQTRVFR